MTEPIRLSVRALVEFLLRGGSIDNRLGGVDRALEGGRIHRRLQGAEGDEYAAEVSLSLRMEEQGRRFVLEGRADGIIRLAPQDSRREIWAAAPAEGVCDGPPPLIVDEIKTTSLPFTKLTEDFNRSHWAQALCYAYICAQKEDLPQVGVRLTYFQIDTEEIRYYRRRFSRAFLEDFMARLLEKYRVWADWRRDWEEGRDRAAEALAFPFAAYRPGQRHMAAAVYRTIRDEGRLLCEAPTGIGKSMSVLFPAVKAMGEGRGEKLFYLTAKTVAREAAEKALAVLRAGGARLKSVTLTAKDKICFLERRACNPEACPYADGHFDRVNEALYDLLNRADSLDRSAVEAAARAYRVCPYELSLDLTLFCDCVICDYNYVFDPEASLKRFFGGEGGDFVLLIDEAHNLVERAREMYSAELRKSALLALKKRMGHGAPGLSAALGRLHRALLSLKKECEAEDSPYTRVPSSTAVGKTAAYTGPDLPEGLLREAGRFSAACEAWLADRPQPAPEWEEELLELYFAVLTFTRTAALFDAHFLSCVHVGPRYVVARLMCLDPSALLSAQMDKCRAAVLFSATMTPMDYFAALLGAGEAGRLSLPSPFAPERLGLYLADRISTRYKDREKGYGRIADLIHAAVAARDGRYMVYFPSYQYLQAVHGVFRENYPQYETIVQQTDMDEEARSAFLRRFQQGAAGETLVGFGVLGGLFAEGVDLKGDRLIGAVIVGVGLPQVGPRQEIIRRYFDKEKKGFAYAYRFPGWHKVLQAAGRVIRDEEDKGVVLLIDDRFATGAYRTLYPPHWRHMRRVEDADGLSKALAAFWNG